MIEIKQNLPPLDAPIPDEALEHFAAGARLVADGQTIVGFERLPTDEPGAMRQELRWFDGALHRSDVVVSVPSTPSIQAATGEVFVADTYDGRLFVVGPGGEGRLIGTMPANHHVEDCRGTADGTLVVNSWTSDRHAHVSFYTMDGAPLGRVELADGAPYIEMSVVDSAIEGTSVIFLCEGDASLRVLAARRQGDNLTVHALLRRSDLLICSLLYFVDAEGNHVRWPETRYHLSESGVGAALMGVDEALDDLEAHESLPLLAAPGIC